jgi:uncharacterized coiled-coil protein SlyX
MKLRRGTAEQELQALEARRTKLESDLERQEATLAGARSAVTEARQVEATSVLDDPDPSAARKRRTDAEAALVDATGDLDVLRRAIEELDRRLEAKRAEVQADLLAVAEAALQRGLAKRADLSAAFATALSEAIAGQRALIEARGNVDELRAKIVELGGDRYKHDADEAERPDTSDLVELLSSDKPRRPVAEHERWERQRQLEAEDAPRRERAHWLEQARALANLTWGPEETERKVERFLADVPDELRDAARDAYSTERAKVMANRGRGPRRLDRIEA